MHAVAVAGVLLILSTAVVEVIRAASDGNSQPIDDLLASVSRLLRFSGKNYQNMDFDNVFALRVIEGQCKLLVEEYESGRLEFAPRRLMRSVSSLGGEAGKLANMALPHVHESQRHRFVSLRRLLEAPWKVFQPHRVVNPSLRWSQLNLTPRIIDERDVEQCLAEVMGSSSTARVQNAGKASCQLTENCLRLMFARGHGGFYLQSQIFYSIVVHRFGCVNEVNAYLVARTSFATLDQVQHEFCSNAYYELDYYTSAHDVPQRVRHLFLETEFFCPSVGYFQFMRLAWLTAIISWQSTDGCFSTTSVKAPLHDESSDAREKKNVSNNADDRPFYSDTVDQRPAARTEMLHGIFRSDEDDGSRRRSRLVGRGLRDVTNDRGSVVQFASVPDKSLSGGCFSRFTSFASSCLAMYLRYLLDPGPPEFVHLRLENYLNRKPMPPVPSVYHQSEAGFLERNNVSAGTNIHLASSDDRRAGLSAMSRSAWNFMGTYQRHWGSRHESLPEDSQLADFVHRVHLKKELPDWTVTVRSAYLARTTSRRSTTARGLRVESPAHLVQAAAPATLSIHIVEIHRPWHRELNNYYIIVTIVSVACLLVFFRYFRQRNHFVKTRLL